MYITESINKYLSDLAARQPTPGGGSAAGLCGALGVALLEMVCNYTKDEEQDIQQHLRDLKKIRESFTSFIDEDVKVYSAIRDAFRAKDKNNIDKALKDGYDISLKMCRLAKESMAIAQDLSTKGNVNLLSDVGCGAEFMKATFNSGIFNCEINLKGMNDRDFTGKEKTILDNLKKQLTGLYKDTIDKVQQKM